MSIYKETNSEIQRSVNISDNQQGSTDFTSKKITPPNFDIKKLTKSSRTPGTSVLSLNKKRWKNSKKKISSTSSEVGIATGMAPLPFPYEDFLEENTNSSPYDIIKECVYVRQSAISSLIDSSLSEIKESEISNIEELEISNNDNLSLDNLEESNDNLDQNSNDLDDIRTNSKFLSQETEIQSQKDGDSDGKNILTTMPSSAMPSKEIADIKERINMKLPSIEEEEIMELQKSSTVELSSIEEEDYDKHKTSNMHPSASHSINEMMPQSVDSVEKIIFTTPAERVASMSELISVVESGQVKMGEEGSISIEIPIQGKDSSVRLTIITHRYAPKQYNVLLEGLPASLLTFALQHRTELLQELALRGICVHQLLLSELKEDVQNKENSSEEKDEYKSRKHACVGKIFGSNLTKH